MKKQAIESRVTREHLSRVAGAGLCDITVVHSVAAAVATWKKLARTAIKHSTLGMGVSGL